MLRYRAPLLQLPVRFDVDRLRREAEQLPRHLWSPDRLSGDLGAYKTLALVARRGRENDEMFGPFAPTPQLAACPYVLRVLAWFEAPVCEVRLRWLGPRAHGAFHFDRHRLLEDRYRIHVPIITTPHATFHCGDRVVRMPAGTAWTFDRMRQHAVFNDDPTSGRLHLIMDFLPSKKVRGLVDRARETIEGEAPLASFGGARASRLEFERTCPPAVWSPATLRAELSELRDRFDDRSRFDAMNAETKALATGWTTTWRRHGSARSGWPSYVALARKYFAAWNERFPTPDAGDERSETARVACLLDTGAFVPARARAKPSWSSKEALRLVDAVRITIDVDGRARASVDGDRWRSMPSQAVGAIGEIARGARHERHDEAAPSLRWLVKEGSLALADDAHELRLFGASDRASSDFVVTPATMARLVSLRRHVKRGSKFRLSSELHFIVKPAGTVGVWLPHVEAYDMLFPDALAIAQHMALGLRVEEVARATGHGLTKDFLLFVAWLWDLLPFAHGDQAKPSFADRLDRDKTLGLATVSSIDPVTAIELLAETGPSAFVIDSRAFSLELVRRAVAIGRVKHVDVLVKTSQRCGVADLRDLPVAGFVLEGCDLSKLAELESGRRPFVVAVIESMRALAELDAIASSPLVDALVVGPHDLAKSARLAGADPKKVLPRAMTRVGRAALRNKLHLVVLRGGDASILSSSSRRI